MQLTEVICKLDTSRTNTAHGKLTESEIGDMSSNLTFEIKNICLFIDSGFLKEGEDVILRLLNNVIELFCGKITAFLFVVKNFWRESNSCKLEKSISRLA